MKWYLKLINIDFEKEAQKDVISVNGISMKVPKITQIF